jgi:hypothetical protein
LAEGVVVLVACVSHDSEFKTESLGRNGRGSIADFKALREGVDDLVRLEVVVDKYLTAEIGFLRRG